MNRRAALAAYLRADIANRYGLARCYIAAARNEQGVRRTPWLTAARKARKAAHASLSQLKETR